MSKGGGNLKELEKRLREQPDNLVLRVTVAGAMREAGRLAEAVELYRSVAIAYRDQGRTLQAVAVCRSILAIAPDDARCQALLDELLEPPAPDPFPPIQLESKRLPDPDAPGPPRRPEVLIPRLSSDSLDETPLPNPMPYHVADPTAALARLTPSEISAIGGARPTPTFIRARESNPPTPTNPTPVHVLTRELRDPETTRPISLVTPPPGAPTTATDTRPAPAASEPAARGSLPPSSFGSAHTDVTAELDTRQRPRLTADEIAKLAPPPTGPIPRIATPMPIVRPPQRDSEPATHTDPVQPVEADELHDDQATHTDAVGALAGAPTGTLLDDDADDDDLMPTGTIAAQPDPDAVASEPEPLPPVRVSSKPGLKALAAMPPPSAPGFKTIPSVFAKKQQTTGPVPLPPPPSASETPTPLPQGVIPDPHASDTEDELTQPRALLFDPRAPTPTPTPRPARAVTSIEPAATRFFAHLPAERRQAALSRFHRRLVTPKDVVIAKDQANHPFVLVIRGELEVRPERGRVYRVGPGEFAGEASLLARTPSTATVVAVLPSQILLLLPGDFYEMVGAFPALWAELKDVAGRRSGK